MPEPRLIKSGKSEKSGGIKPLNAPRVVHVRTDPAGNPVAVQVPPAITSSRGRRGTNQAPRYNKLVLDDGLDPHPNPLPTRERGRTNPPSLGGRELEGGSKFNQTPPVTTRKARELRRNATPAENLLWKHLRKTRIPKYKFTRQYPIGPYFVGFCCRPSRLIVELAGGHHATQQEADADRQQYLEDQGYRVIRFWNNEIFENLEGVLFRIAEALEDVPLAANGIHPHPTPLPTRERGLAPPPSLVSDGKWVKVTRVEDLWKVSDEWWRGPEEEIARLYYTVRLENGQQLTVYLDLITNSWYRQTG